MLHLLCSAGSECIAIQQLYVMGRLWRIEELPNDLVGRLLSPASSLTCVCTSGEEFFLHILKPESVTKEAPALGRIRDQCQVSLLACRAP